MSFLDKLKNVFFEEEEIEEEQEQETKLARKIEIPKKKPPVVEEKINISSEEEQEPIEVKAPETVKKEPIKEEPVNNLSYMFEEEDFVFDEKPKAMSREYVRDYSEKKELYPEKKTESYTEFVKKDNNYGYTKTYYESKETKIFKPSPIISPIYGILDKNYKKEEVITRKEIKITSNREKLDLDSVRNKAFGEPKKDEKTLPAKDIDAIKDDKIYDVNVNKPSVKGVTLEDADEYYRDLGLAYNVDYSDKVKDNTTMTRSKKNDKIEDNLFDLIESMYDKED